MIYANSLSHPNMFSTISGKTMVDSGLLSINKCISLLITTGFTELFGMPEFGSGIYEATFDFVTDNYLDTLKLIISDAIKKYEHRVQCDPEDIKATYDETTNHIHITVGYTIVKSGEYSETELSVGVNQ